MIRERLRKSRPLIMVFLFGAAIILSMTTASRESSIGLTLEWESIGSDVEINYVRTEGGQNERKVHTHISKSSPAHYALMPGDVDGIPKWMEIEWQYGIIDGKTYEEAHRFAKYAKAHIDLKALIPMEYIEEVARDRNRKQLKLTGTFNDDKLSVRAEVYQWRD
ncbi:hypothetical protein [Massilia soli]|nr:hypothetical protein [Massilia soli]